VQTPLTVNFGGQSWQPGLSDIGVTLDGERTAAVALQQGRAGDPLTRLLSLWQLWRHGIDVPPHISIDRAQLQSYLMGLGAQIDQPPRDAGLHLVNNRPVTRPAVQGLQLLVDASANDMVQALETLQPHEITLRTRVLDPVIGDNAAAAAAAQAEDLLSSPLVLTHNDDEWTWGAEEIAHLVRIEPQGERISVAIDPEQLTQEVNVLASSIDTGSVEPRLHYTTSGLEIVQPGQVGWSLQNGPALHVISDTLHSGQATTRTVELPADELHPRVVPSMLAELGIHELVGEGRSSFAGSAEYRITNIKAGAARMDGVLIAPGEEFSFNTQLGEVDAENGFVEGYAVVGNRTKLEWGGGVCQDSTTVFRAAFWAGLPITERHAHPFYISWYDRFGLGPYGDGAGLDAAIYTGLNDLRFVNDTGNWLLMQTNVDEANQVLTVQLYGTNPNNRQVTIDGPHISNQVAAPRTPVYIDDASKPSGYFAQTDAARNGWDITIHRIVTENGAEVSRDTFFTRFKAWPNVFVRGTGG
jgi:vancomycin resistance protein YoaR